MHNKSATQSVFLETSIQFRRTQLAADNVEWIDEILARPTMNAITSQYVWMEYLRTFIADCAHVHRLMGEHERWGTLLKHLLEGQRGFRPRSAVRCTYLVGELHEQYSDSMKFAQEMLGEQIYRGLFKQFWTNVTPLPDPIACDLVAAGVTPQLDGTFSVANTCRKATAVCHLPIFLTEKREKLCSIAEYLAAHPKCIKQQSRVEQLLAKVLDDPQAALGQSTCWPLGDIIIALQVPDDAMLWTLDADFTPLAAALGLSLYNP